MRGLFLDRAQTKNKITIVLPNMAMKTAMKILATIFSIFNLDKDFTLPWITDSQTGILGRIVSFPALQSPLLLL
jgi:hypothetical protein